MVREIYLRASRHLPTKVELHCRSGKIPQGTVAEKADLLRHSVCLPFCNLALTLSCEPRGKINLSITITFPLVQLGRLGGEAGVRR